MATDSRQPLKALSRLVGPESPLPNQTFTCLGTWRPDVPLWWVDSLELIKSIPAQLESLALPLAPKLKTTG